jgi:hypothetical protein
MDQLELMRFAVAALERLGLRYYVTGSMASMRYGEARLTNDIDIVIELPAHRVRELCAAFPEDDFYVSEDAAAHAALHGGQFNVIRPDAGLKVDFIVRPTHSPDHARFDRALRLATADGGDALFTSPEDSIVSKLDFFRQGESDKHLRDIASILKIRGDQLDLSYISSWVSTHGLDEVWAELLARTGRA